VYGVETGTVRRLGRCAGQYASARKRTALAGTDAVCDGPHHRVQNTGRAGPRSPTADGFGAFFGTSADRSLVGRANILTPEPCAQVHFPAYTADELHDILMRLAPPEIETSLFESFLQVHVHPAMLASRDSNYLRALTRSLLPSLLKVAADGDGESACLSPSMGSVRSNFVLRSLTTRSCRSRERVRGRAGRAFGKLLMTRRVSTFRSPHMRTNIVRRYSRRP